jgi:type VII secretion protein EssA
MKRKLAQLVFYLLLIMTVFHLTVAEVVRADTTKIEELVPNDYQQNEFESNTDLLKDDSSANQASKIPEEQKGITFEKEKVSKDEEIKKELFLSAETDQNTVKAKAVELELFTAAESTTSNQTEEDPASSSNLTLSILIWALVGICSLLLIVVLFVWGKSSAKQKSPQNI